MNTRNPNTRVICRVALLVLAGWGAACSKSSNNDRTGPPHDDAGLGILLITVDGLEPEALEAFGGSSATPNLKTLISEGRGFSDAWTTSPMTRPAVTTYLTGLTPDKHGVWDDSRDALGSGVPTLAHLLGANGFQTAAFPDAARLGFASGLLGGFDVVDEPPSVPLGVEHWKRELRDSSEQLQHFDTWLASVEAGARWFAWLHLSTPAVAPSKQTDSAPEAVPPMDFDDWLGKIRESVSRLRSDQPIGIAVAGTFASTRGEAGVPAGIGMSIGESAVAVPVILRLPAGSDPIPGSPGPVWAPDIPVTLAALAGLAFEETEGRNLSDSIDPDRILFSWSMAPRDQIGWGPISAARRGDERFVADPSVKAPTGAGASNILSERLAARSVPLRAAAAADLRSALSARGLRPRPIAPGGREFGPSARRLEALQTLLVARDRLQNGNLRGAQKALERHLSIDPDSLVGLLDLGQLQIMGSDLDGARRSLSRAVELYPDDPETVHWYVHATWDPSDASTEALLRLILPERSADPDLLYDLACLRSLGGDIEGSEELLRSAIEAGFQQWGHMEVDPDLRGLRESGRFAAVMRELRR